MFLAANAFARADGVGALRNCKTANGGFGSFASCRVRLPTASPITGHSPRSFHPLKREVLCYQLTVNI